MDRALCLLMFLKFRGTLRRWGENLKTPKGVILSIVGLLVFVPWMISAFLKTNGGAADIEATRRYGPWMLVAYTLMTLLFSTGERGLYFSPSEVAFLFTGPFSRRGLLIYKMSTATFGAAFSAVILNLVFARHRSAAIPGFLGVLLTTIFIQFLSITLCLASETLEVLALNRRRKWILSILGATVGVWAISVGSELFSLPPPKLLERLGSSPAALVIRAPFQPFIDTFAAPEIGLGLVGSASICLAIIFVMAIVIIGLDASYYEASAVSSAKLHAKIMQFRRTGIPSSTRVSGKARFGIPMPAYLGGAGPTLWRQTTTVLREPGRLFATGLIVGIPAAVVVFTSRSDPDASSSTMGGAIGIVAWLTIIVAPMLPFDFRGDVDRIGELKALPFSSIALTIGELLVPTIMISLPQWLLLTILLAKFGQSAILLGLFPALPLLNFLLIALENFLFLLYPSRTRAVGAADLAAFGRQILGLFAKLALIGVAAGAAFGAAFGIYLLAGIWLAIIAAEIVLAAFAFASIPAVAWAFRRFDVARDVPL